MKMIVIGGVAAGMSAASKIKRLAPQAEVTVYEKGEHLSYGACGLPYFAAGINDDYKKMLARTKEQFEDAGIAVKTRCEIVKVIPQDKTVLVKELGGNSLFLDTYDKLLIATGANAIRPNVKGASLRRVHLLKTLEDGFALKEAARQPEVKNVVVVGGGYIGIEVAETMHAAGKNVRVIEFADRILQPFDDEIEKLAREHLIDAGIALHLGEKMEEILDDGNGAAAGVKTDLGSYEAELVVLALGIRPATGFLQNTGMELQKNGAIVIDREMRTSIADIYAAGDCATVYSEIEEENVYIALGTTANKCGRIAGENMLGGHIKFTGTLGSAAIKVVNLELGRTGMSEATAKMLKIDYSTAFIKTADHAAYYPNPTPLWIKVICEKRSQRILGAQAIGEKGAVLRVDVFAVAISARMTAPQLGMTDLCYAPPFAGVWDAVNIAANAVK